jgi:hypothetical protein
VVQHSTRISRGQKQEEEDRKGTARGGKSSSTGKHHRELKEQVRAQMQLGSREGNSSRLCKPPKVSRISSRSRSLELQGMVRLRSGPPQC